MVDFLVLAGGLVVNLSFSYLTVGALEWVVNAQHSLLISNIADQDHPMSKLPAGWAACGRDSLKHKDQTSCAKASPHPR